MLDKVPTPAFRGHRNACESLENSNQNIDRKPFGAVTGKAVFIGHIFAFGLRVFFFRLDFSGIACRNRRINICIRATGAGLWMRRVNILLCPKRLRLNKGHSKQIAGLKARRKRLSVV